MILVDFVLESGNGELDGTVNLSFMDVQSENEDSFADRNEISSPEVSALPESGVQEAGHISNHRLEADRYEYPNYRHIRSNSGSQVRTRSWPLRDPEEASLLMHFVDQISSFVSHTGACDWSLPRLTMRLLVRLHRPATAFCCLYTLSCTLL